MIFGRILIACNVALFLALAAWMLLSPSQLLAAMSVQALSTSGAIELHVMIAGSFFAFAGLVVRGCFIEAQTHRSLGYLVVVYACWLLVRLIAFARMTPDEEWSWAYLAFEVVMLGLLAFARLSGKPRHDRALFSSVDRGL